MGCCQSKSDRADSPKPGEKGHRPHNATVHHESPGQPSRRPHSNGHDNPPRVRHRPLADNPYGDPRKAGPGGDIQLDPRGDDRNQTQRQPSYGPPMGAGRHDRHDDQADGSDDRYSNTRFPNGRRPLPPDPKPPAQSLYGGEVLAEMENYDPYLDSDAQLNPVEKGIPWKQLSKTNPKPLRFLPMDKAPDQFFFLIKPFEYNASKPDRRPFPISDTYTDRYDKNHVVMPCSPANVDAKKQPKWPRIQERLRHLEQSCLKQDLTPEMLERTFNDLVGSPVELTSLHNLIGRACTSDERQQYLTKVLPCVCALAADVDRICGQPPRVLRHGNNESVTMSQLQAASLLACSFFCLFPQRPERHGRGGRRDRHDSSSPGAYENFPSPNFFRLYEGGESSKVQKLKCILHYFERISEKMPNGVITFRRHGFADGEYPRWDRSKEPLCQLSLTNSKKIEDFPEALQVDFANKFIGGGVLGHGCVQEEIRFTICPEMLVSLLLCQRMDDNEVVFLIGCERFSNYDGYADSFKYAGDYQDQSPRDNWGRRATHLVAIDAVDYRDRRQQYEERFIFRELRKAYTGFMPSDPADREPGCPVITGNWGCGAFNGDRQLKALIQLIAASQARRPLTYAAYGDRQLVLGFNEIYSYLLDNGATVADVYNYLRMYSQRKDLRTPVFEMIKKNPIGDTRF